MRRAWRCEAEERRVRACRGDQLLPHLIKLPLRLLQLLRPACPRRLVLRFLGGERRARLVVHLLQLAVLVLTASHLLLQTLQLNGECVRVRTKAIALLRGVVDHCAERVDLLFEHHVLSLQGGARGGGGVVDVMEAWGGSEEERTNSSSACSSGMVSDGRRGREGGREEGEEGWR